MKPEPLGKEYNFETWGNREENVNYPEWEERYFGYTKQQIKSACEHLKEKQGKFMDSLGIDVSKQEVLLTQIEEAFEDAYKKGNKNE